MAIVLLGFASNRATAQPAAPAVPGPVQIAPSKQQLGLLIYQLQAEALRGDQKIVAAAKQVFDKAVSYRLNQEHFPESISDLQRLDNARTNAVEVSQFPPRNPFADPSIVSKELRQELINSGMAPSEFCKIIIESDQYLSASFALSLSNVKLKPESAAPGTIVVKYNGDYYLAVWCMGFTGKPILDEKTKLPLVWFKDFSISSCQYSERAVE